MILTHKAIVMLAIGAFPLALSSAVPGFVIVAIAYNACALLALLLDYLRIPDSSQITVERECEDEFSLGNRNPVALRVRNLGNVTANILVRDEPPSSFPDSLNTAEFSIAPRGEAEYVYHVVPDVRGDFQFGDIYLRLRGRLGLVMRQFRCEASRPVRVYPNIHQARKYDLMRRRRQMMNIGDHRTRMLGLGSEFESLRDYQPDDEFRHIDWKASARRAKLTTRQYQVDRTQNILLVLDTGRTMCVSLDGMSKLDYAINAALMLGHVASSGDDRAGLLAFSNEINAYLPPRKGRAHFLGMLQALYNIPLTTAESDYDSAFRFIASHWRKRSLVVVFTDLVDPDSSARLIANLAAISRKHLCVCVAVRDPNMRESSIADPTTVDKSYEMAAALQAFDLRRRAIAALTGAGVAVVDSDPSTIATAVVDKYSHIKARVGI